MALLFARGLIVVTPISIVYCTLYLYALTSHWLTLSCTCSRSTAVR